MNIHDIENNLNSFESDGERMIPYILQCVAKNQAMLEIIIAYLPAILSDLDKTIDKAKLPQEIDDKINRRLKEIQADISGML